MNVYTGVQGSDGTSVSDTDNGVFAFVNGSNATLAIRLLNEIIAAQKSIALIKGDGDATTTEITGTAEPFRNQISDAAGRALIQTAINAVNTLQATLENDVLPLVGTTGFSN
ncbi:MAG TPA: hypothetical protein DD827_03310 [Gammaproteobacteria bacterium]|jgi:hypothetical protein|nr:hypothetical protein [Gammaproteobacteria bacterium]